MNIIDLLKHYDKKYDKGNPEVSDTEYDTLRETAKDFHPDDPYFKTVGAPGEKVRLPFKMGSLNKVKIDSVMDWLCAGEAYVISEKLDGSSIMVEYRDGHVVGAYRRGDGEFGQDITEKAKIFCPTINVNGYWVFRGEAILDEDPSMFGYKNRRNGAAGLLNKDGTENCQYIKPRFYEIVDGEDVPDTEWTRWKALDRLFGAEYMPKWWLLTGEPSLDKLVNTLKESRENNTRYDVDGLVLCLDESEREDTLYPTNKVAFKVNLEAVKTTVRNVEWKVTRTGRIVPVVHVDPINILGVTVSKVTGHNYELLSKMGAGIGAEIGIVRSGDVIPYIEEVYLASGDLGYYRSCPSCYAETEINGVDLVCINGDCIEKLYYKLEYWFRTLGAENLTGVTLKKLGEHISLYSDNTVPSIFEIYDLEIDDMLRIESFGRKRATQVYEELQNTLKTSHEKLLAAFGIPNVAKEMAVELVRHFGGIHGVLTAPFKELLEVEGIGEIVATYIRGNQHRCVRAFLKLRDEYGLELEERKVGALTGKMFCITGKLPMGRDAVVRMIEAKGGVWKNAVVKGTDYLVTDNPNSGSSKNKKAQTYGTKIISFTELQELLNE